MGALDWGMLGLAVATAAVGLGWHWNRYRTTIGQIFDDYTYANAMDKVDEL